jgi:hypothetical protein
MRAWFVPPVIVPLAIVIAVAIMAVLRFVA